jgi:non-specific serine/threonine protein kinase
VPIAPLAARSGTLPMSRTSFVGRADEVAAVRASLLDDAVPILTLTGPGGVGKTRLALAAAHAIAGAFADGVVFVDLSAIRDRALVLPAIAGALGVREDGKGASAERLAAALRPRQLLLVLDNCEQILAAAADVASIVNTCPALQVLATSRAPLRVQAEHLLPVAPLALPDASQGYAPADLGQVEAIALFVARARAADPAFALAAENAEDVAKVCRRLDGLPLAIELAAARLRVLSVATLLALLTERLRLLTGGEHDRPDRQRTLRNTIAWSYELLPRDEQALFRRLAVFAGGFDAEAALAVNEGDPLTVLDRLTALSDQSLVQRLRESAGGIRWSLLETIREFGLAQLAASGEDSSIRGRHLAWCLSLMAAVSPPDNAEDFRRLDAERDNLRAAPEWAISTEATDAALRLVGGLAEYWWSRGDFSEGRAWFARALALPGGTPALRVAALSGAVAVTWYQGHLFAARELAVQCLTLARTHGDPFDEVHARLRLAQLDLYAFGNLAGAKTAAEEALVQARTVGDSDALGWLTKLAADAARGLGDAPRAASLYEEAIHLFSAGSHRTGELYTKLALAGFLGDLGRRDDAVNLCQLCAKLAHQLGNKVAIAEVVALLARLAIDWGQLVAGARLVGLAEGLAEPMGLSIPDIGVWRERAVALARGQLGAGPFAVASDNGRALASDPVAVDSLLFAPDPIAAAASPGIVPLPKVPPKVAPHAVDLIDFGLSRREREVLAHLARRYTDPEIAEALFLSVRTVENHVAHIFNKLGVNNRREAAAFAARHGLV